MNELERLRHRPDKDEINAMPLRIYDGEVRIVRTLPQWQEAEKELRGDGVLGFDTETRPTFRKGKLNSPALVQLASAKMVYIVQLAWLPFGQPVADLLADPNILKVGVGIRDDMRALAGAFPFTPAGIVDLGDLARKHNIPNQGLRNLAASLFGWRISKGAQCSNWNLRHLTDKQIAYAATDAWIGRMIYLRFEDLGLAGGGDKP